MDRRMGLVSLMAENGFSQWTSGTSEVAAILKHPFGRADGNGRLANRFRATAKVI
jgi:hypothetical protein